MKRAITVLSLMTILSSMLVGQTDGMVRTGSRKIAAAEAPMDILPSLKKCGVASSIKETRYIKITSNGELRKFELCERVKNFCEDPRPDAPVRWCRILGHREYSVSELRAKYKDLKDESNMLFGVEAGIVTGAVLTAPLFPLYVLHASLTSSLLMGLGAGVTTFSWRLHDFSRNGDKNPMELRRRANSIKETVIMDQDERIEGSMEEQARRLDILLNNIFGA